MSVENWLVVPTWMLCGLIWFVQVVHYPLLSRVGRDVFTEYHRAHMHSIAPLVATLMGVEVCAAATLTLMMPSSSIVWIANALLILVWVSTAMIQVPQHRRLADGFDEAIVRQLVSGNWIRTIAWTIRAALLQFFLTA